MALTKTVNYVQNNPQDLGFNNEISGATGEVTVTIGYSDKGGRPSNGFSGSAYSSISNSDCATDSGFNEWSVTGTEAEVNAILNELEWIPRTYESANEVQDPLSANRLTGNNQGEILIETGNRQGNAAFFIGQQFLLSPGGMFQVRAIETTKSQYRMYATYSYNYSDDSDYEDVSIYNSVLKQIDNTEIDTIVDYVPLNPSGRYTLNITVSDTTGVILTGLTTLQGSLFVQEPYFTTFPPTNITSTGSWQTMPLGQVAQPNNELVEVQILFKRFESDPLFTGNVDNNEPTYVDGAVFGCFNEVQVDNRISTKDEGIVQWRFYGTPAQCNRALNSVRFKSATEQEFIIETRIINSRARIYYQRGYN